MAKEGLIEDYIHGNDCGNQFDELWIELSRETEWYDYFILDYLLQYSLVKGRVFLYKDKLLFTVPHLSPRRFSFKNLPELKKPC
ncbi:MAG: hypothetical protein EA390_04380 [Balneolaceae bacterium]|nr:MAG: hypothetical protein EA390_04380 [Balneolaceae bacterium]